VRLTISSTHGLRDRARKAYVRIAGFLAGLRENAEQLDPLEKWYRILSEALRHFHTDASYSHHCASTRPDSYQRL
jgi:hypothetical protein